VVALSHGQFLVPHLRLLLSGVFEGRVVVHVERSALHVRMGIVTQFRVTTVVREGDGLFVVLVFVDELLN